MRMVKIVNSKGGICCYTKVFLDLT